jgi:hypothetical protein
MTSRQQAGSARFRDQLEVSLKAAQGNLVRRPLARFAYGAIEFSTPNTTFDEGRLQQAPGLSYSRKGQAARRSRGSNAILGLRMRFVNRR